MYVEYAKYEMELKTFGEFVERQKKLIQFISQLEAINVNI